MTVRKISWAVDLVAEMLLVFDLIIRGQVLDITVQRNVPRSSMGSICGWNLFETQGLDEWEVAEHTKLAR